DSPGIGETAEWRLPDPRPDETLDLSAISDGNLSEAEIEVHRAEEETSIRHAEHEEPATASETNEIGDLSVRGAGGDPHPTTRVVVDEVELPDLMGPESDHRASPPPPDFGDRADWFAAADGEPEWPAFASPRRRQKQDPERQPSTDRVRYLFPVPDATDWEVGELRYERRSGRPTSERRA